MLTDEAPHEVTDPIASTETAVSQVSKPVARRGRPPRRRGFRIVVASDGSPQARVAIQAAIDFPWPANAEALGVIARGGSHPQWSASAAAGIDTVVREIAGDTERALRRRWSTASVVVDDAAPVDAILRHARGAGAIVVGSRGQSRLERWMVGSVSRGVVRQARTPVLVVKKRPRAFRHLVVAYDGSNHARRALEMVASLKVPSRGRVTLLTVVDAIDPPSSVLLPGRLQRILAREAKAFGQERMARAREKLQRAARPLVDAGWRVRVDVRAGVASRELVTVPAVIGADVLVIGAKGAGGWTRLMLGSVAEAILDRASVSTLLVR